MKKRQEQIAKKMFKNADPQKISAMPAEPYGNRFLKFMKNTVFEFDKKSLQKTNQETIKELVHQIEDHIKT